MLKFFIIFVSMISIMFFSLIFFHKASMEKMAPDFVSQMPPGNEFINMERQKHTPPMNVPIVIILGLSSILVYLILNYINKNFIIPLSLIEKNVKQIKNGVLDVDFVSNSENAQIIDTFKTLNEMTSELKQKEKLQDNFIQNLIHDLRSPVIAQERAIEILQDEFEGNELIEGMAENNEAYLKMINDIIEALSQKEVKIEKIEFNFSKLADKIISALEPVSSKKNIEIKKSIQDDFTVWADYLSVNRIVLNLVSNAIENLDNDKRVIISAVKNANSTIITIEDNGKGMNSEQIERLFKKYVSGNKSSKKSVSGLGLSIVKDLVNKNNGTINVESQENLYTKFIIELPNKD